LKSFRVALQIAVAWLLIVTILFCIPGTKLPRISWQDKVWFDKWIHLLLFLVLVVLWCRAYSIKINSASKSKKAFIWITILSLAYGAAIELVQQYFIPFRYFDYRDMIADGLGCLAGYFISIKRFIKR
jgi:VanZ family protein